MFKLFLSKEKRLFEKNDDELMKLIQEGNHNAFSALVHRYFSKCYSIAYRFLGSINDSEDVVQIVFLKIWNNPFQWKGEHSSKVSNWLYRIITNQCIDLIRSRKPHCDFKDDILEVNTVSCEEQLAETEEQRWLEKAIIELPTNQKTALNLCFYEGLSNKEASEIMSLTTKAVQSLLMRAKAKLKKMWSEHLELNKK